jgi:hypothetical protein
MVRKYNILEKIDVYGSTLSFRMNNTQKHKTKIGGIITIITLLIFGFLFYEFGQEMLFKTHPSVHTERMYDPDNNVINISSSKELFLSFTLCKEVKREGGNSACEFDYDPEVFNIHSELVITRTVNNRNVYERRSLNMSHCTEADIHPDMRERFNYNSLNYSMCIRDPNVTIQGQFDSSSFQYLRINIDKCVKNCKPPDVIKKLLSTYKLSFYFTSALDNSKSYENPVAMQMQNFGSNLDYNMYKRRELFFMKNFLVDDENMVFKEKNNKPKLSFSSFDIQISEVVENNGDTIKFFGTYIRISPNYLNLNRNYKKVPLILSEVFATIKHALIIVYFLVSIVNFHPLKENLLILFYENNKTNNGFEQDSNNANSSANISKQALNKEKTVMAEILIDKQQEITKKKKCCGGSQGRVPYYYAYIKTFWCCCRKPKRFADYDNILKNSEEVFSIDKYIEIYLGYTRLK